MPYMTSPLVGAKEKFRPFSVSPTHCYVARSLADGGIFLWMEKRRVSKIMCYPCLIRAKDEVFEYAQKSSGRFAAKNQKLMELWNAAVSPEMIKESFEVFSYDISAFREIFRRLSDAESFDLRLPTEGRRTIYGKTIEDSGSIG